MSPDDVIARIITLTVQIAGPERTPREVGPDTMLTEGGFWLDSVALLEVIVACEAEFAVEFDSEEDLTTQALESVGSLAEVIRRKLVP
jgi:acyl carrier protein